MTRRTIKIAGAVLGLSLLLTACGEDEGTTKVSEDTTEQTQESEEQPTEESSVPAETQIADTYEAYINGVLDISEDEVNALFERPELSEENPSDDVKRDFIDAIIALAPDAFERVDTRDLESLDDEGGFYTSALVAPMIESMMGGSELTLSVDETQIVVDGDTAVLPPAGVSVLTDGTVVEGSEDATMVGGGTDVKFVKVDGEWFVLAEVPENMGEIQPAE